MCKNTDEGLVWEIIAATTTVCWSDLDARKCMLLLVTGSKSADNSPNGSETASLNRL